MEQFNTVDTDHKNMQYVETPAMMVIDGDGNLIFSGFAHDNLMKRSPLVKMEAKTVLYVDTEPEPKSVGRFVEFRRNCVRVKCYAALSGPYGPMHHDYFWFDVDKSTWQKLWEFCTRRVNGKPNKCRATIAQNIDFRSDEQVGSKRSASVALSSQNPYLVLGAPGDLDVWKFMKNHDDQVLTHDLQRLKDRMQNEFDHLEMAWWNSDRTINFYTDTFVKQTYRHGDECLKRLLEHMHKQRRLTGDTRNVVEMSIEFLRAEYFTDRRNEQGGAG